MEAKNIIILCSRMVCLETSKVSAATVDVSCLLSEKSVNFLKRHFFKLSACGKERIGY